jgi:hypothetical protein
MTVPNWTELSAQLPSDDFKFAAPLHVTLGEATDVANFFRRYWEARREGTRVIRPGLESAGEARLPAATASEIESLIEEVQKAHNEYLRAAQKGPPDMLSRARFVLDEIVSTLEWLFDDGVEDDNDAKLAAVETEHRNDPATTDALALALEDFAGLAEVHKGEMHGLGGFDVALLDEARKLATELRNRPVTPKLPPDGARAALAKRNRLLQLLQMRMNRVRAAARFVFRHSPAIVREATSAFARRRRAETRRAKARAAEGKAKERGVSDDVVV